MGSNSRRPELNNVLNSMVSEESWVSHRALLVTLATQERGREGGEGERKRERERERERRRERERDTQKDRYREGGRQNKTT